MSEDSKKRLAFPTRLLAEGFAIVASILLAFAIDAWWDGLQERRDEVAVLGSLLGEFEANSARIPASIARHDRFVAAADEVIRILRETPDGEIAMIADTLLAVTSVHHSFEPVSGALQAVLQSGDLHLIENRTLRELLAKWPSRVVDATENEDHAFVEHGEWHAIVGRDSDVSAILEVYFASDYESDQAFPVRSSTEATTHLGVVNAWEASAASEFRQLLALSDSIVSALEGELDP